VTAIRTAMASAPESVREDDVDRTLRMLRGLAELGVVPRSVRVGDVEVGVASVSAAEPEESDGRSGPPVGGYIARALAARRVG